MILSDLQSRLLTRLGENSAAPIYYGSREAVVALNAAQRIMAFLTLCLETTGTFQVASDTAFTTMLSKFPDWILPLRIRIAGGAKLKPCRFSDLAAIDAAWSGSTGNAVRYALGGFGLLGIYQQPHATASYQVTYARCPVGLVNGSDVPEVPVEFHPALIQGAIPLMRAKEGGGEWKKVLDDWDAFLAACRILGSRVRARNKEQGYDNMPIEIGRLDRSVLAREAQLSAK